MIMHKMQAVFWYFFLTGIFFIWPFLTLSAYYLFEYLTKPILKNYEMTTSRFLDVDILWEKVALI